MRRSTARKSVGKQNGLVSFMLAFFGGSAVVLAVRLIGDTVSEDTGISVFDFIAAIFATVIIGLYAFFIWHTRDRSNIPVDRSADNVYYLGLLFTLVSLAYSLVKLTFILTVDGTTSATAISLDDGQSSTDYVLKLLPDFGVALASTIAGIFGRILLLQPHSSGGEEQPQEKQVRDELRLAADQLRITVGQIILDLNGLSAYINVTFTETNKGINKILQQTTSETMGIIKRAAIEAEEVATLVKTTTDHANQVINSIKNIQASLENFDNICRATLEQSFGSFSENIQEILKSNENSLDSLSEKLDAVKNEQGKHKDNVIADVMGNAKANTDALAQKLNNIEILMQNVMKNSETNIKAIVEKFAQKHENDIKDILQELAKNRETNIEPLVQKLVGSSENNIKTLVHNLAQNNENHVNSLVQQLAERDKNIMDRVGAALTGSVSDIKDTVRKFVQKTDERTNEKQEEEKYQNETKADKKWYFLWMR